MAKAPHRPVITPDDGGALLRKTRPPQPRNAKGVFIKREDAPPAPGPVAAPKASAKPKRAATPAQLVARLMRTIEAELTQIEEIVVRPRGKRRGDDEKLARRMATLARSLAEMMRLRSAANEKPENDKAVPRDLDELRATLERRLARLVDPAADEAAGAADAA